MALFDANTVKDLINRTGAIEIAQESLLASALRMKIPMAMVPFGRASKGEQVGELSAGMIMTLAHVWWSLFVGSGLTMHYTFFSGHRDRH
jgi:Family of unknown function (DUF6326)